MKRICVYCGSSDLVPEVYLKAAEEMGTALADRGSILVYGAGSTGVMGALADQVLKKGGEVWGIIPKMFDTPQLAHDKLSYYEVVDNIHTRKARMIEVSDGFIALPGGFGTFEELFEVITWAQIGLHRKPVGLLNTHGYYDPLITMINQAESEGFIYSEHRKLFSFADTPDELLLALQNYTHPEGLERWIEREG